MFASARTATAGSPLASPSLKHFFEFAHAHSPLVGLGISIAGQGASSSSMHTNNGSGQPVTGPDSGSGSGICRPPLTRMSTSVFSTTSTGTVVPRTPRMPCTSIFSSVFSPFDLTPTGVQSSHAEGYFSDDNFNYSENISLGGGLQSFSQNMDATTSTSRFAAPTNTFRPTMRSSFHARTTYPEVEPIGLGITGLSLNSLISSIDALAAFIPNVDSEFNDSLVDSSPEDTSTHLTRTRTRARRRVSFNTRTHVIDSSNTNTNNDGAVSDGYSADNETECDFAPRLERRASRHSGSDPAALTQSGLRSCKSRVLTPFYAPNGETSWL